MSAARAITCPACGGTVEVRAAGFSVNLVCVHCSSILDVSRPEVAVIRQAKQAARGYALDIGARGQLLGNEWEIVGASRRKDAIALWQEFLLFNPYLGYRWLVVADGEWQFGTPLADRPTGDRRVVQWRDESFKRLGDDQVATVTHLAGEFYWRLTIGDHATCTLFQHGDVLLSRERSEDEENWTQLVPVPEQLVADAFALRRRSLPRGRPAQGLMGFKPRPGREVDDLPFMFLLAAITAIVAFFAVLGWSEPVTMAQGGLQVPVGGRVAAERIGTITVTRPYQFVTFSAATDDFHNRWVDLEYSLVDRATQQSIDAYGLVEYYTGTDSDGAWSEGSHRGQTMIGRVPRGTYDVYVGAAAHGWPSDPVPSPDAWYGIETIQVQVDTRTGGSWWGMWLTLVVAVFVIPCTILWARSEADD